MPLAPQREAVPIKQAEIRIIFTEESGIEYQVMSGSFLPLANIERVREKYPAIIKNRVTGALQRRGFSWSVIRRALAELLAVEPDDF